MLAHAAAAVGGHGVLHAGPPGQPVDVPGHRLDLDVDVELRQPGELLHDHRGLEGALGGQRDVLEVAAAAQARPGVRARRLDPVGRGVEHLDGVAAPEPVALGALGDLDDDAFAGQRVPHEHDAVALLHDAGDAVAAVRDRADGDLEAGADAGLAAGLLRAWGAGHGGS